MLRTLSSSFFFYLLPWWSLLLFLFFLFTITITLSYSFAHLLPFSLSPSHRFSLSTSHHHHHCVTLSPHCTITSPWSFSCLSAICVSLSNLSLAQSHFLSLHQRLFLMGGWVLVLLPSKTNPHLVSFPPLKLGAGYVLFTIGGFN